MLPMYVVTWRPSWLAANGIRFVDRLRGISGNCGYARLLIAQEVPMKSTDHKIPATDLKWLILTEHG